MNNDKDGLTPQEQGLIISVLKARFEKNMKRHPALDWTTLQARLEANPEKLWSLHEMERTGGEPDVVGHDGATAEYLFVDCSAESPKGRRSVCYDHQAQTSRKEHKAASNAVDMAAAMGVELLGEDQYRALQQLGPFDLKTSSWLATPHSIRHLGGALFGDHRYSHTFVYHNGAESYYSARGFRCWLRL